MYVSVRSCVRVRVRVRVRERGGGGGERGGRNENQKVKERACVGAGGVKGKRKIDESEMVRA